MKNKYGMLGFISLLGVWGLYKNEPLFLSFFAFALFFEYFWVTPDELFLENIKKASTLALFTNFIITTLTTFILSMFKVSSNALAGGCILGFSVSIVVFCFSVLFIEWKEKRGIKNDI